MAVNIVWKPEFEITFTRELWQVLWSMALIHYSSECKALVLTAKGGFSPSPRPNGLLVIVADALHDTMGEPVTRTLSWRECDILLKVSEMVHVARCTDEMKATADAFVVDMRRAMELAHNGP